jgi:hypothetical protein
MVNFRSKLSFVAHRREDQAFEYHREKQNRGLDRSSKPVVR